MFGVSKSTMHGHAGPGQPTYPRATAPRQPPVANPARPTATSPQHRSPLGRRIGQSHLVAHHAAVPENRTGDTVEQAIIEAREDGELDAEEGSMLLNILSLDDTQVQDIADPRTDIDCVEVDNSLGEVIERIVASGHSRIARNRLLS